ncbi:MAG: hypothetical protein ACUVV6_09390 [Thermoplasmatota archaeon]
MMELLTSKVVGAAAVLVLLGSVVGVLSLQNRALEEERFRDMCDRLASTIDSASSLGARVFVNVEFAEDGSRLDGGGSGECRLLARFRGEDYSVEVHRGQVVLRQGELVAARGLVRSVHPWPPSTLNGTLFTTSGELARLDAESPVLMTQSGRGFVIETALVITDGESTYSTFAHF